MIKSSLKLEVYNKKSLQDFVLVSYSWIYR